MSSGPPWVDSVGHIKEAIVNAVVNAQTTNRLAHRSIMFLFGKNAAQREDAKIRMGKPSKSGVYNSPSRRSDPYLSGEGLLASVRVFSCRSWASSRLGFIAWTGRRSSLAKERQGCELTSMSTRRNPYRNIFKNLSTT